MLKTQIKETSKIKRMLREGAERYGIETDEQIMMRVRRASVDRRQKLALQAEIDNGEQSPIVPPPVPTVPLDFPPPPTFDPQQPATQVEPQEQDDQAGEVPENDPIEDDVELCTPPATPKPAPKKKSSWFWW